MLRIEPGAAGWEAAPLKRCNLGDKLSTGRALQLHQSKPKDYFMLGFEQVICQHPDNIEECIWISRGLVSFKGPFSFYRFFLVPLNPGLPNLSHSNKTLLIPSNRETFYFIVPWWLLLASISSACGENYSKSPRNLDLVWCFANL